ncbi:MAG: hypothetical protein M3N13_01575 [Candidatus Eremiobacteraeota bacterium]|nr:hypothetical protein [Candidatus Eremiobacteraeota bacterium]
MGRPAKTGAGPHAQARRIGRVNWLTARIVRRERVGVQENQHRFGVALGSRLLRST